MESRIRYIMVNNIIIEPADPVQFSFQGPRRRRRSGV
jgi:hypothetical protein